MKRRLADKLVLLVRAQHNALSAGAGAGDSSSSSSSSRGWTFPHASYQAGETIRQTAERALREAIGQSQVCVCGGGGVMPVLALHAAAS
jgi:ADP-ribose pyrophosphatase YjhB (NUDIX family)